LINNKCAFAIYNDYIKRLISDVHGNYQLTFFVGIGKQATRYRLYVISMYAVKEQQMLTAYSYLRKLLLNVLREQESVDIERGNTIGTIFLYLLPQTFCARVMLARMLCPLDTRLDVDVQKAISKVSHIPYAVARIDVFGSIVHFDRGDFLMMVPDAELLEVRIYADMSRIISIERYTPSVTIRGTAHIAS